MNTWTVGTPLTGTRCLALAIIKRAMRDARSGNGQQADALDFLHSDGCCELLGNVASSLGIEGDASAALGSLLQREGLQG